MKKRSKQNNPEQKTRDGVNNADAEFARETDVVPRAKKAYEKTGGQPVKSKFHQEQSK
jgi:hypothetical protein